MEILFDAESMRKFHLIDLSTLFLYFRIDDVLVVIHQFIDHSKRTDFNNSIGHGLREGVVMRSEKNRSWEVNQCVVKGLN